MNQIAYYQNITGEKGEDPLRKDSMYWNEGKWKNFIKPLLPTENRQDMTFVDIGASNGLFCSIAEDEGFRNVIGIEADSDAVERGWAWRNKLKKNSKYLLLHKTVGVNFGFDEMPVADVYLLANVHYYFKLEDWLKFLDRLFTKTEYCLIITRPFQKRRDWQPLTSIDAMKHYFRDWELVRAKYKARDRHAEFKEDPKPRVLHSMLFRSRLRRKKFSELRSGAVADPIKIDRFSLIKDVVDEVFYRETQYYKAWYDRMYPKRWSIEQLDKFVGDKYASTIDIIENGMKEPIIITGDHKTIDGKHRQAILEYQGYQSIMTRMI